MKVIYEIDDDLLHLADQFFTQHFQQHGGYLPYVFTEHGQYGTGIGSFLSGLWSKFSPMLISAGKSASKEIGKQALSSVADYAGDLAAGADWREAGEERLREAGKNLSDKLVSRVARAAQNRQAGGFLGGPFSGVAGLLGAPTASRMLMNRALPMLRPGSLAARLIGGGDADQVPTFYNSYGARIGGPGQDGGGGARGRRNKSTRQRAQLFSCVPVSSRVTRKRKRNPARRRSSTKKRRTTQKRKPSASRKTGQRRKVTDKKKKRKKSTTSKRGRKQRGGDDFASIGWL